MDSQIIQSLWIGKEISLLEKLTFVSFMKNGHEFHLYTYDEIKDVPEGVVLKDASRIIHPDKIFKYKHHDSYAGFSNIFRYKLLLEKGGWWVDTDVICLIPFAFNQEYVFARQLHSDKFKNIISKMGSCVIKVPAGSDIMDYCYARSISKDSNELEWGEIGPNLVTHAVTKFGLQEYAANYMTFSPLPWTHVHTLISENINDEFFKGILQRSSAIHLWNEMWRRNKLDKNAVYPPNSIYELLKNRYFSDT